MALSDTRVLSVRAIAGLVVLQTAEPLVSEVRTFDPLGGASEITHRSRALRVLSHLSIPDTAVGDVRAALAKVIRHTA